MTRKITGGVAGWVFGLSVSVFLIAMWGRAMVVDTERLAESMTPLAGTVPVVELVSGWLGEELIEAGVEPPLVDTTVRGVMATPAVSRALDRLVLEVILAAGTASPRGSVVDVAAALRPALPEITDAVGASLGGRVPPGRVAEIVNGLDPLVVVGEGAPPHVGPSSPVASRLGTAAALALVAMVLSGWVAAASAPDPILELRRLLSRVALGALSFGVILRIGAWVLSPTGGRAPLSSTLSELAGSKWLVPVTIGAVAGAASLGARYVRRARRGGPPSSSPPTLTPAPAESVPSSTS